MSRFAGAIAHGDGRHADGGVKLDCASDDQIIEEQQNGGRCDQCQKTDIGNRQKGHMRMALGGQDALAGCGEQAR